MIRTLNVDDAIDFLNELARIDQAALYALVEHRAPCNQGLAEHPTVQVIQEPGDDHPVVGMLGILNGLFGTDDEGWGAITAVVDDANGSLHFARTVHSEPHVCREAPATCQCFRDASEPSDKCPLHGNPTSPPRCHCGRFVTPNRDLTAAELEEILLSK